MISHLFSPAPAGKIARSLRPRDYGVHDENRRKNCLRFCIPRTYGNRVANIDKFILAMDMKMTNKAKNGRPPPDIKASPCNNFLNSVIGALSVSYNNTVVCKIDRYPIFNYCKKMLTCDDNDFKTWAETQCFYPEAEDEDLDNVNTEGEQTNYGHIHTKNKIKQRMKVLKCLSHMMMLSLCTQKYHVTTEGN